MSRYKSCCTCQQSPLSRRLELTRMLFSQPNSTILLFRAIAADWTTAVSASHLASALAAGRAAFSGGSSPRKAFANPDICCCT